MALDPLLQHSHTLEARFTHDDTRRFLSRSRATHQVALWAAHQAGQEPEHAERYARQVVAQSCTSADLHQVIARICKDLREIDRPMDEREVDQKLRVEEAIAWTQL